jgi:hypothetical protein
MDYNPIKETKTGEINLTKNTVTKETKAIKSMVIKVEIKVEIKALVIKALVIKVEIKVEIKVAIKDSVIKVGIKVEIKDGMEIMAKEIKVGMVMVMGTVMEMAVIAHMVRMEVIVQNMENNTEIKDGDEVYSISI